MSGCDKSFNVVGSTTGGHIWLTFVTLRSVGVMKRVGMFPYTHSSGEALHTLTREVTPTIRNSDHVQVKRIVGSVPVKCRSGPQRTLELARVAASVIYGLSSGFLALSDDVQTVEDKISEEHAPWDFRELMSRACCGCSDLLPIQVIC